MSKPPSRDPLDLLADAASAYEPPAASEHGFDRMVSHALIAANAREARKARIVTGAFFAMAAAVLLALLWPRAPQVAVVPVAPAPSTTSHARLTLATGDQFVSTDDAELDMTRFSAENRALRLTHGTVLFDVISLPNTAPFTVETADARVLVRGTVFSVTSDASGTRVHVFEGRVDVQSNGRTQSLVAGDRMATQGGDVSRWSSPLAAEGALAARARALRAPATPSADAPVVALPSTESAAPSARPSPTPRPALSEAEQAARLQAAQDLLGQQRFDDVIARSQAHPNDGDWLMLQADALRGLRRIEDAVAVYDRAALRLTPSRAVVAGMTSARLRFERLHDATGALASLDASHADVSGSSVEEPAFVLRLRALAALDRQDDLVRLGRVYLARYPNGSARQWLESRINSANSAP